MLAIVPREEGLAERYRVVDVVETNREFRVALEDYQFSDPCRRRLSAGERIRDERFRPTRTGSLQCREDTAAGRLRCGADESAYEGQSYVIHRHGHAFIG